MGYTFADELIMLGVKFHPETVVIDASNVTIDYHLIIGEIISRRYGEREARGPRDTVKEDAYRTFNATIKNRLCLPIFPHTLIVFNPQYMDEQFETQSYNDNPTIAIYITQDHKNMHKFQIYGMYIDIIETEKQVIHWEKGRTLFFEENGTVIRVRTRNDTTSIEHNNTVPHLLDHPNSNIVINTGISTSWLNLVLFSFELLHEKTSQVELITPSRQVRRRLKRKHGKEPSPYFMLKVNPEKPQKRYIATPKTSDDAQAKRRHLVRGHFRTTQNHPIAQFNGTRFIPAHFRGDLAAGEVKKGYTIVLD